MPPKSGKLSAKPSKKGKGRGTSSMRGKPDSNKDKDFESQDNSPSLGAAEGESKKKAISAEEDPPTPFKIESMAEKIAAGNARITERQRRIDAKRLAKGLKLKVDEVEDKADVKKQIETIKSEVQPTSGSDAQPASGGDVQPGNTDGHRVAVALGVRTRQELTISISTSQSLINHFIHPSINLVGKLQKAIANQDHLMTSIILEHLKTTLEEGLPAREAEVVRSNAYDTVMLPQLIRNAGDQTDLSAYDMHGGRTGTVVDISAFVASISAGQGEFPNGLPFFGYQIRHLELDTGGYNSNPAQINDPARPFVSRHNNSLAGILPASADQLTAANVQVLAAQLGNDVPYWQANRRFLGTDITHINDLAATLPRSTVAKWAAPAQDEGNGSAKKFVDGTVQGDSKDEQVVDAQVDEVNGDSAVEGGPGMSNDNVEAQT
ncbi:hypothetical protein VTL71DRAFT_12982 [Oculimacula yallundae]|uniref:Uncharacterized protein n=1 Tax=Oculimacula yallundae TaxID=86028 RepID=A0ABR4CQB4_9HELO